MHERLLTNHMRLVRHMTATDICSRCRTNREDIHHLLKNCSKAKAVWLNLKDHDWWHHSNSLPLQDWIKTNMCSKVYVYNIQWSLVFATALWLI